MQIDRLARRIGARTSVKTFWPRNPNQQTYFSNEFAFCACVQAIFWSNLSERAFAGSFAWGVPDVGSADVSELPTILAPLGRIIGWS